MGKDETRGADQEPAVQGGPTGLLANATGDALGRDFYRRDAEVVAAALLGKVIVHRIAGAVFRGRIVETEAYVGTHDLACHASKGRTRRTEVMFGPPGYAYVYLIYGMHDMFNVVTGPEGSGQAVLVRAAEPLGDEAPMNGPGRLARAMAISRSENGADLCDGNLVLVEGPPPARVVRGPRINVAYAGDWQAAPLRFYDARSAAVSR
jgi:DNA-3-methyladenine glycosylase